MKPVRVLVVDDSATMRALIASRLRRDPEIEVVGGAGDPLQAREMIKALDPDVLTLDVEMPRMNGIEFLERLMRLRPMPVIMVSTLTQEGAETTLQALELGAFDCVGKPATAEVSLAFDDLADKVKSAAKSRVRPISARPAPVRPTNFRSNGRVVAIGASTGGVEALITVLSAMPENCPPIVVTQHMPATFTKSFAARLDRMCAPQVSEAEDGEPLKPGRVLVAPGGARHMEVGGAGASPTCRLRDSDLVNGHRPSVDVLFHSVAGICGPRSVGLILTGMGKDGARGLAAMRAAGARTFGQNEATCVVYGMPKVAFEIGAVEIQAPLNDLSRLVLEACTPATANRETI